MSSLLDKDSAFDPAALSNDPSHINDFDQLVEFRSVIASHHHETHTLRNALRDLWERDLRKKMEALRKLCPQWEECRETLLDERTLVQEFLQMGQASYNAIGPLAQEIRSDAQSLKKIQGMPKQLIKAADETANFGTEMLAGASVEFINIENARV